MSMKETEKRLKANPRTRARIAAAKTALEREVGLHELREGRVTQAELAGVLGISQRRVSAIEHSTDVQVSTLRSYLGNLGYELELVAKDKTGERIPIKLG